MKPRPSVISVLFLTLSLSLLTVACSDDSTTTPQLTGDGGTAQALLNDTVLPIIEGLNLADIVGLLNTPPGSDFADIHCTPLDICVTGTAEWCPEELSATAESAPPQSLLLNFNQCVSSNTTVTGSILLTGDSISGVAAISLALNGTTLTGTVSYSAGLNCFNQNYSMTVTTSDFTMGAVGTLVYCTPPTVINEVIVPTGGSFTFIITSEDRSIDFWFYESETPGSFSLDIWDLARSENLLFCTGALFGSFECGAPPPNGT